MRISAFISAIFLLLTGCSHDSDERNNIPEDVEEILKASQFSPDHLSLTATITTIESDSIYVNLCLVNSSTTISVDSLYHSSSFPQIVAYNDENVLTLPLDEQIFFDDLNTTFVKAAAKNCKSYGMKRLTKTPYKITAVFRFRQNLNSRKDLWLASTPLPVQ